MITLSIGLRILCGALCAFRLTWELVVATWLDGLRARLGRYTMGEDGQPVTRIGRWLLCPYCVSALPTLIVTPLIMWPSPVTDAVLIAGGVLGAVTLAIRWRAWEGY